MASGTIARVRDEEIFAGIDELPWAETEHCFGPATDTPQRLRDLRSPSEGARHNAIAELCTSIYHLGTRFPASHLAVPYLARLALAPDTPDRHHIIGFLTSLAIGHDTDSFPAGADATGLREMRTELLAHTPLSWEHHLDTWVAASPDERVRRSREGLRPSRTLTASLQDVESELLAYEAVLTCLPSLRALLWDTDEQVQAATAYLLAWFREECDASLPALTALLAAAPSSAVAINVLIALGMLSEDSAPVIAPYLTSEHEPVAWAAAAALAAAGAVDPAVIAKLCDALASDATEAHGLLLGYGEFPTCAQLCLAAMTGDAAAMALDGAIAAYARGADKIRAAKAAIALAFGDSSPQPRPPFAALDQAQRRVLRALVDGGPEPWRLNNYLRLFLRPRNMPGYFDDLQQYVEADAAYSVPTSSS